MSTVVFGVFSKAWSAAREAGPLPHRDTDLGIHAPIDSSVSRALDRVRLLAGDASALALFATPLATHYAVMVIATDIANALDELLERISSTRRVGRTALTDDIHALASSAAGELRHLLRTQRSSITNPSDIQLAASSSSRDGLGRIGLVLQTGLAALLGSP